MIEILENGMEAIWKWIAITATGLYLGALSWVTKRQLDRIRNLEDHKADKEAVKALKEELKELVAEFKAESIRASASRDKLHSRIGQYVSEQHQMNVQLATVVGKLEALHEYQVKRPHTQRSSDS